MSSGSGSVDESQLRMLAEKIIQMEQGQLPGVFNRDYWQGVMMDWVMRDPSFKVDLFRFVDVLPTLTENEQVARHVREYLLRPGRELPAVLGAAIKAASYSFSAGLSARAIKKNVGDLAQRFIIGKTPQQAVTELQDLHRQGFAFTVDLLGEATLSAREADSYQRRYLELVTHLSEASYQWPAVQLVDNTSFGTIPRANISVKVSAMGTALLPQDPRGAIDELKRRISPLMLHAKEKGAFINLDLEQWSMHEITYGLFEELLLHPELRSWPHVGIVVQAYLRNALSDVSCLLALAKRRGAPITVRLVKGAYWDFEIVNARQNGFECPVFTNKESTDANYEAISKSLIDNIDHLRPAFGSHNLRSLAHAITYATQRGISKDGYELQMLYGMAEPFRQAFAKLGHRVRLYAPVGDMLPGMAYLVRRLLENTSNSGFLRLSYHNHLALDKLIAAPAVKPEPQTNKAAAFRNCAFLDYSVPSVRESMATAITKIMAQLPLQVAPIVNGKAIKAALVLKRACPSASSMAIAQIQAATSEHASLAAKAAAEALEEWQQKGLELRCQLLERLGDRLEKDRAELAALMTLEVAKPWLEADADVAEAVDFCRYYAARARQELSPQKSGDVWGEDNIVYFDGRGVCAVIAPWNFPLAILCGMSVAALVTGNTVVMKPAEQSSAVAYELFKRMLDVGFPEDVVQFLPGLGEEVGAALVRDPNVVQVAFTGSKAVGQAIVREAAVVQPGQIHMKRVVCEMGGKNATIVDDDADLDEAVLGILKSAFGYAGQKCSACSRVLVVGAIADAFMVRLVEATRDIVMEKAHNPSCVLGPVVDEEAQDRLEKTIARARAEASTLFVGSCPAGGYFVPPSIFEVSDPNHWLMQNELFGPVLAVMRVRSFDEAIQIALSTEFALTGAVYSRSPVNLEKARQQFRVGNLYLNRPCTGAMVERQPFGGFKMSGLGTKAGGPGYLLNFVDMRCVSENTMRRGFTPEIEEASHC